MYVIESCLNKKPLALHARATENEITRAGGTMATAKNPGIGQGKGGGRPKREGDKTRINLDISREAGDALKVEAEASGRPLWAVLDALVLASLGKGPASHAPKPPELPI